MSVANLFCILYKKFPLNFHFICKRSVFHLRISFQCNSYDRGKHLFWRNTFYLIDAGFTFFYHFNSLFCIHSVKKRNLHVLRRALAIYRFAFAIYSIHKPNEIKNQKTIYKSINGLEENQKTENSINFSPFRYRNMNYFSLYLSL